MCKLHVDKIIQITRVLPKLNEVKHIKHEQLQSANTSFCAFYGMCLSKDGSIIMSGKKPNEDNCWLKCTVNGVNLWEVNTAREVYGCAV